MHANRNNVLLSRYCWIIAAKAVSRKFISLVTDFFKEKNLYATLGLTWYVPFL